MHQGKPHNNYTTQLTSGDPVHNWSTLAGTGFNTAKLSDSMTGAAWGPMDYLQKGTTFKPTIGAGAGSGDSGGGMFDWMNKDSMTGFGSAMKGLGSLATGWAALKNLKLTRQAMDNQQNQWQTNFDAQRLATNNQIANQNAWKQAQGRTDYGSYVGGKPSGTQYVG